MKENNQDLFQVEDENTLDFSLRWWEKRRLRYNIIVGIAGLTALLAFSNVHFIVSNIIYIIFYGLIANFFYLLGFFLEALIGYYFKTNNLKESRNVMYGLGLIFSILLTVFLAFAFNFSDPAAL